MALPRAARTQRRTRIQEAKEEQILEAALEVFSLHGFRGATVDQIAEVAGMSKPNLLYYFRTKEAMHRALITRVAQEMNRQIANYIRGKVIEIVICGGVTYIAFVALGLNYAALLALLVGVSVVVP